MVFMSKLLRSLLSVFISITMVLTVIPFTAIAKEVNSPAIKTGVETTLSDNIIEDKIETEPIIVGEIISKRESNVKHFKMSDGSYTAAVYPYDVHFENADGEFQDIDNSLSLEKDGGNDVLSNKSNVISVKFMKKSNPNKLYTISKGEHKIKVSIDGVSKVNAVEYSEEDTFDNSKFKLKNIGSRVAYTDILDNTDIEFTLKSTELKENIILKEAVDFNSLIYTYHLNESMNAVQEDSKNIILYDKEGNFVFNISAPVIWDATGNASESLTLEILEYKNSKIKVKLSWDIHENAKYPVTIDPVMSATVDRNQIQDTHIISSNPDANYDVNNHIRVRNDGYSMLRFPTPNLTSGDKIVNAQLALAPYGAYDTTDVKYSNVNSFNPPLFITAHKILRTWEETTATYNNINPENGFYDSIVQSYSVVDNDSHYYYWDITRLVNEWTEGYSDNHGLLLKYAALPSDGSLFDSFFCSTNGKYLPVEARPQLIYNYVNTTGIESYYSYHTQNLGYAGTGYTNDLTGNLTVVNEIYNSGGSLMPISVSLVYNLSNVYDSGTPYGSGWWLNWAQKIDWAIKSNLNNNQYVKYTDGDGTEHFFTIDSSTGIWSDEINPDRKIYFIESTGDYKMTDSSGTCMYFTRNGSLNEWYLYKVEDVYGNNIMIILNSSNLNRVDKVYSSTGNIVDFVYNEYGFLIGIKYYDESASKTISVGYNNHVPTPNNCISNFYYPDGTYVQYHYYDNTKYLSKTVDISGQSIGYNYKWSYPLRVNYVAEYSINSELGAEMSMYYQPTATVFTDMINNRKYLYTFAQNGTLKSTVDITDNDGNGYGQYYEYNNGNADTAAGTGNLTFVSKTQKNTVNLLKNHSFESTGEHAFTAWDETTGTASGVYSTEKSHIGTRSYKITRPTSSNSSRAMGFYYMYIEGGKTYTLSAYVNTSGMTSVGNGASLLFIDSEKIYESEYITETSDKWQRLSLTFTAKKSEFVSICMNLSGATGSVYFDNIQLEAGDLSDYNLLENAGFEQDAATDPIGWGAYSNATRYIVTDNVIGGNRAAKIIGNIYKDWHYEQKISIPNGKSGDTFVASAFAKANSVPADGWKFTLLVRFCKNDVIVNDCNIMFNSYTSEWQKVSGVAKATGDYDTVQFWLLYYGNCNTVYFDNAQLIKDTFGNTYTYDSKGNLISTVDLQGKEEYTFKYDGNNKLIKETSISGSKILYTYNLANRQQLDIATAGGNSTYYDYDSHGNAVSTGTYGSGIIDGQYYYLQNLYYNKYLDTDNFGTADGTIIKYWDLGQNSAQRWKLIKNSDGTYSLSPECAPNSLLSVEGSSLYNTAKVALYSAGAVPYQKFNLTKLYGNIYRLDVASTGYSLDGVESGCYVYESHQQEYQQFALIPAKGSQIAENPVITSSATYSSNGEYMTSVTDGRGYTTSYEYEDKRGYLDYETNAKGVITDYSYNASELLNQVKTGNFTVSYGYDSVKRLTSITSPSGTNYSFVYNSFGRTANTKVGSRTLSSNIYDNAKGLLDYTTYGNGTLVDYSYDALGRHTDTIIDWNLRYQKLYDGSSRLIETKDILAGKNRKFEYDILGRLTGEKLINGVTNLVYAMLNICYDDTKNRVAGYDVNIEGISKATDYVYGENKVDPNIITSVKHNGTTKLSYSYDSLNRLVARTLATGTNFATEYTYIAGRDKGCTQDNPTLTTTLVKTVKNGNDTLEYSYDALGNITSVSKNGSVVESYTYDNLNQLKTVTVEKGEVDDVYTYTYDNGGNILSVKKNGVTEKTYTYGDSEWKDLLKAYNGQTITYDNIGNPLTYRDGMSFTWTDGRKLASITKGEENIAYTYDINGLRTSKTVNGVTTEYYWLNGMLQGQKTGSEHIIFLYDENGTAYGFLVYENGVASGEYYYIFNAQGDVIGILDSQGTQVVEYTYNPWGEILSTTGSMADTIGQKNPLRYRGYYYDSETGFYYLQSRYYDPVVQRFINADGQINLQEDVTGYNLFQYCGNNPVNRIDTTGNSWKDVKNWFADKYNKAKKVVKKLSNKLRTAGEKIMSAFTVELGLGMGVKGGVEFSGLDVGIGFKADSITVVLNTEDSKIGQCMEGELSIGVGPIQLGPQQSDWYPVLENDTFESEFTWIRNEPVLEFGIEFYIFYGYTANLSIDMNIIAEGVVKIFE